MEREPTLCTCQSWRGKRANTVYMSELAWKESQHCVHVRAGVEREPTLCTCQSWRGKRANTVYMSELAWKESQHCVHVRAGVEREPTLCTCQSWRGKRANTVSRSFVPHTRCLITTPGDLVCSLQKYGGIFPTLSFPILMYNGRYLVLHFWGHLSMTIICLRCVHVCLTGGGLFNKAVIICLHVIFYYW